MHQGQGLRLKIQNWAIEHYPWGVALAFILALVLFFAIDQAIGSRHFFHTLFVEIGAGVASLAVLACTVTATYFAASSAYWITKRAWVGWIVGLAMLFAAYHGLTLAADSIPVIGDRLAEIR